ncbi:MAG: hypothetical protein PHW95_04985 [Patescibacteria group bacterium]|nr:hypothetical protein [Patescibacteria group bacterium]
MFLTIHATAGVLIAESTNNVLIALSAGLISHFILDIIPHGDQHLAAERFKFTKNEVVKLLNIGFVDSIITLVTLTTLYLTGHLTITPTLIAALTGCLLPDFLNSVYLTTGSRWLKHFFYFQNEIHFILNSFTINLKVGLIVQALFLVTFLEMVLH